MIKFSPQCRFTAEATIILISEDQIKKKKFPITHKSLPETIKSLNGSGRFTAKPGEIFPLPEGNKIILLTGLGKEKDLNLTQLRVMVKRAVTSPYLKKSKTVQVLAHQKSDQTVRAVIEGVLIGGYRWKKYKTEDKDQVQTRQYILTAASKKVFTDYVKLCAGVNLARDLVNDNADVITSSYFEKTIRKLIKGKSRVKLEVLNRKQLQAKGLNLHLAVNQGSKKEPKLIIVRYQGGKPKDKYTAFVGKGITFDTGGINLKPSGHIEDMRCDMSGAASVVGLLKNALSLNIKRNLIFAVGLAENAIGSLSYKPGDVFRSYSGKTVEIGNTDAEGRLVLADALSYLVKNFKPARIIDLATLTGACIVALGYDYTGLISNNDGLAKKLIRCSVETDDWAWRLPNDFRMKEFMKSEIADIHNISSVRGAGTCTAGEFLRQFVGKTQWAHLDIAGTAFSKKERMYFGSGASGAGVRLLTDFLQKGL